VLAEIYLGAVKLSKQMQYANKKGIPFVVIQGDAEAERGGVSLGVRGPSPPVPGWDARRTDTARAHAHTLCQQSGRIELGEPACDIDTEGALPAWWAA
jgi:hypothetical protein